MPSNIAPFSQPGQFWRGNIHTHSTLSDGKLDPPEVIAAYADAGYDFMVLSDHFIGHYNWPVADTRKLRTGTFTTIIGAEVHAPKTSVGELWHIVAAGLPLDFPPCGENETGAELARRAAEAGAFVGIAHPAWSQLTIEDGHSIDAAHAVEIYNHGCAVENDRGDGWYLLDQMLNDGKRLTAFATDDAHFHDHDRDAFGGWIHVKSESLDPDTLLTAMKAGHFYASQGPQIFGLSIADDHVEIECSPVDVVSVVCGNSRSAVSRGRSMTQARLDLSGLDRGWLLEKPSDWYRIVLIDGDGRRAWTNPVWRDTI
ncbi:MAG: CehA/McbA family metallohydrolase [Hyphomicrobiaceae bacterium]